jgi:hypothetical protein
VQWTLQRLEISTPFLTASALSSSAKVL